MKGLFQCPLPLVGDRNPSRNEKDVTALCAVFSKITPSLFTLKEGSTSHPDPLSSGAREETALLGAQNRFALRLADHQRSSPYFAGWDRLAVAGGDLMLHQSPRHGCAGWDRLGKAC